MKRQILTIAVFLAVAVPALPIPAHADDDDVTYSEWSSPESIGAPVNSVYLDIAPFVSRDERSMYFFSDRPGGFGGNDIWVSERKKRSDPWGEPVNLGPTINTEFNENAPTLSPDGRRLYFGSDRPGGFGGLDLYVSERRKRRQNLSWQAPENLGSPVNTFANEAAAAFFEDDGDGQSMMYFQSNRPGGIGLDDIFASPMNDDGSFGEPVLQLELSSPFLDRLPGIRRDGREIFISSNRPGGFGFLDIWVATREDAEDVWSTPVNLGGEINSPGVDGRAMLNRRGTRLYFHSTRDPAQAFDIYTSSRKRIDDDDCDDEDDD
ncbi:MAG: hypothetical protein QNI99_12965 [Woeseiaceae bacterium]|nr:hypothetical protein [Woeseiaceae bacterium]